MLISLKINNLHKIILIIGEVKTSKNERKRFLLQGDYVWLEESLCMGKLLFPYWLILLFINEFNSKIFFWLKIDNNCRYLCLSWNCVADLYSFTLRKSCSWKNFCLYTTVVIYLQIKVTVKVETKYQQFLNWKPNFDWKKLNGQIVDTKYFDFWTA